MLDYRIDGSRILVETGAYQAEVRTEGFTSGVYRGSFIDKKTGATELGFGLGIVDFLLEPSQGPNPEEDQYRIAPEQPHHGGIAKRYVEGPQICTKAKKLPFEVIRGEGFLVVKTWYRYTHAYPPYQSGSRWEQTLVFPEHGRYFFAADRVTSANDHPALILRVDMPGHLRHTEADNFAAVYLSYHGAIPAAEFLDDFPPDAKYLYRRGDRIPDSIVRGYRTLLDGKRGPWLLGMTLNPAAVYEAWCHQRRYICFIEEVGGRPIHAGQTFGACHCMGWFDHLEEMEAVYETHRGWSGIALAGPNDRPSAFSGLDQNALPPVRRITDNPA